MSLMKKPMRWGVLVAIVGSLLTVACTKKKSTDYGLDPKDTLRVNLTTEPPSLDWNKSADTTSALVTDNIMEGLVKYDLNDPELSLLPALATKWTPSNKAQKWVFEIRKGVKWTDGVELTAQHIKDGWLRLIDSKTASEYAYFLFGLKNAQEYNQGKVKDPNQVGVSVDAEGRLVVELKSPMSYFPYLLTHHSTYPIRLDVIQKHGDQWTEPQNIQTVGAYKLKIWDHDKALVMERNENYYGTPAKIKNIVGYMVTDMTTAVNLFKTKRLDSQRNLMGTELKHFRARDDFHEKGILGIFYFGLNTKRPPMDNLLVRKAISYAIDREEVTKLLDGGQKPLTSWIPAGMMGHEEKVGLSFNVKRANELLDQAGYKDRSKFPLITLGFNTNENHQRVAENIQAQLKKNLKINVEVKNEEWKVYLKSLRVNAPHIYRMGWLADFPDPDNFLNLMTSYSDNNHTNWGNPKYDKLIEQAVSEVDKEKRKKMYHEAQKILTEVDVPVVPVYSMVDHMLVSERVKNYPINSMSKFIFKDVEIKN